MATQKQKSRGRAEVGSKGEGEYFRIEVRDKSEFITFRYHDVGEPGKIMRLSGKRANGSWDDHAWLIDKKLAHVSAGKLVGDVPDAQELLAAIGPAKHVKGDIFQGHPREEAPERQKSRAKT